MKPILVVISIVAFSLFSCKPSTGGNTEASKANSLKSIAKIEVKVSGMHCEGCEKTIETNVKNLKGIVQVKASFKENKAMVAFDSLKTTRLEIAKAINESGYPVDTIINQK